MDRVAYLSGVSGGAWGSIPYCYLPHQHEVDRFLGPKYMPEEITPRRLRWNKRHSLTHAVTHAQIANRTLLHGIAGHEAFSQAVGDIFLHPFDIPSPGGRRQDRKFFSTTPEAVAAILKRNPELTEQDFLTLRPNAPYPIVNGVMLVPKPDHEKDLNDFRALPFDFTPLYSGTPVQHTIPGKEGQVLGGGWLETLGFKGVPKSQSEGLVEVELAKRFEMCESLGISGAAIAKLLVEFAIPLKLLFPQYPYWNPSHPTTVQSYEFGDSGVLENLGIVPLLMRQVKNIVVLSTEPFDTENPMRNWDPSERAERQFGYNQIAALFGDPVYQLDPRSKDRQKLVPPPAHMQVFANADFARVRDGLQHTKAHGGPAHYRGTFTVQQNDFLGVPGGWECNILWMCVDNSPAWKARLPQNIQRRLGKLGLLDSFPIVRVFGQNPPHIIQLYRQQANLLGNLAYWMVIDRQADFRALLG